MSKKFEMPRIPVQRIAAVLLPLEAILTNLEISIPPGGDLKALENIDESRVKTELASFLGAIQKHKGNVNTQKLLINNKIDGIRLIVQRARQLHARDEANQGVTNNR